MKNDTENEEYIEAFHTMLWETATENTRRDLMHAFSDTIDKGSLEPIKFMLQKEGHTVPDSNNEKGNKRLSEIIRVINLAHNNGLYPGKIIPSQLSTDITPSEAAIVMCHLFSQDFPGNKSAAFNMMVSGTFGEGKKLFKLDFNPQEANMIINYAAKNDFKLPNHIQTHLEGIINNIPSDIVKEIIRSNSPNELIGKLGKVDLTQEQAGIILSLYSVGVYGNRQISTIEETNIMERSIQMAVDGSTMLPMDNIDGSIAQEREKTKEAMDVIQQYLGSLITTREAAIKIQDLWKQYPKKDTHGQPIELYVFPGLKEHISSLAHSS